MLAYSTISQLGYMFLGLGTGIAGGHRRPACFTCSRTPSSRPCLFLGAGSVMHAMGGVIDMRRIRRPAAADADHLRTFLFGCLALAGLFPLAGFWSKDADSWTRCTKRRHDADGLSHSVYSGLYWIGVFTAVLTAFYTFRAFFLTFFGEERIPHEAGHHAHESPRVDDRAAGDSGGVRGRVGGYYGLTHGILNFLRHTPSLAYSNDRADAARARASTGACRGMSTGRSWSSASAWPRFCIWAIVRRSTGSRGRAASGCM